MPQTLEGTELIFEVHEAEEGGFWSRALGEGIVTQAETWDLLKANVREAVACHFGDDSKRPKIIRLHFVRDEVIAA